MESEKKTKAASVSNLDRLRKKENRKQVRARTSGSALIHDLGNHKIYKARLKDISADGMKFEVKGEAPFIYSNIMLELEGALADLDLGMIKCTVMWIQPIGRQKVIGHLFGLKIDAEVSPKRKLRIESHIRSLLEDNKWY